MTTTPSRSARPTIAFIADELGVSVPTVSKVLNGRPDVSAATRERVEEALRRHGYKRRRAVTPTGAPPLVDLVIHELGSVWALEIIQGVERAAAEAGVGVVLSTLGGSHHPEQDWLDRVLARRPVGVILVMSRLDPVQRHQLESRSIPFVVVDTDGETPADVATVGSNNWHGGLSATRHLLGLGHRRVAVVSGPEDVLCSRARIDGFRSAHEELRLGVDPALVRHGNFVVEGGYRQGRELLERPDRPTAIFAGSDMQALGVLRAARELGLRVPEDLSLVGYDNLPLSAWVDPPLTTVNQPLHEMAATATRMLVDTGTSHGGRLRRVDLATDLVVRGSTAAPPEG
ncbi:LacI family DNA-binding transcriptional regulator [Desertihabitans aurantiacus]|uniref:LacI family DNA-binding transcriptional regulator n=1 Tax=Desertihabitans aurantiacus TaxID=2282477 RepID=UPI000DF797A0|nr:LacI family DNA-binding transcriptional regulator [Desertihabitans aurantiacus]